MVFEAVNAQAIGGESAGSLSLRVFREAIGEGKEKGPSGAASQAGPGAQLSSDGPRLVFPNPLPSASELTELLFDEALKRAAGNQSIAARLLGVTPQAVSKRLNRENQPTLRTNNAGCFFNLDTREKQPKLMPSN